MSFSPKFTITNAIAAGLTKIERARGFLEAAKLSDDWIAEMQNRALVPASGEAITEALVREIHTRLVKGVSGDKALPGQYRKGQNYVANSKTGKVPHGLAGVPTGSNIALGRSPKLATYLRQS